MLSTVVLQNVPTTSYNLRPKALYLAQMARRVILAHLGLDKLDDKVCVCACWCGLAVLLVLVALVAHSRALSSCILVLSLNTFLSVLKLLYRLVQLSGLFRQQALGACWEHARAAV